MLTCGRGGLIAVAYTADYIMYKLYTKMASLFLVYAYVALEAVLLKLHKCTDKACSRVGTHSGKL